MRPTIVVIDPSVTIRKVLEITFERDGWSVCTFADGKRALLALKKEEIPVPLAIVLDARLPNMNGYAVARALKRQRRCRHCLILFLSAQDSLFDKLQRWLAGGTAYLSKPFRATEVLQAVKAFLQQSPGASARSRGGR